MQGWIEFYSTIGGFAATLLGLLFVAVSINAPVILSDAHVHSKRLAEQAFQNYLAVMMVSLLAIYPTITVQSFGFVTLSVMAVRGAWVLVRLYLTFSERHIHGSYLQTLRRQFASFVGFGLLIFAAVKMAFNSGDTRELLATSLIVLLFSATTVAWELLLTIAKIKLS
jgi:hypothetical protein